MYFLIYLKFISSIICITFPGRPRQRTPTPKPPTPKPSTPKASTPKPQSPDPKSPQAADDDTIAEIKERIDRLEDSVQEVSMKGRMHHS